MKINSHCHRIYTHEDMYNDDLQECELCNMFDVCRKEYLDTVAEISDNNSLDTYRGVYLGNIYKRRTEPKNIISVTADDYMNKVRELFKLVNDH